MTTTRLRLYILLWHDRHRCKCLSFLHMVVLRHKTARHFIHHWMTRMKKGWTTMVIIMITDWSNWFLLMNLFFFLSFLRFGCFRLFFWLFFHNWHLDHFFHWLYRNFGRFFYRCLLFLTIGTSFCGVCNVGGIVGICFFGISIFTSFGFS